MERRGKRLLTGFSAGLIAGFAAAAVVFGLAGGLVFASYRNKETKNYVEKQIEIEALREDISGRSADELLDIPDIRRAADGAAAEFERKRDEILQRFRNRLAD